MAVTNGKDRDKREVMQAARQRLRKAQKAVEAAESSVRGAVEWLPKEGSTWRKHPSLLREYESDAVWTFLHLAWTMDGMGRQHAVVSKQYDDGKVYVGVVLMDTFLLEYVQASAAKPKRKAHPKRKAS